MLRDEILRFAQNDKVGDWSHGTCTALLTYQLVILATPVHLCKLLCMLRVEPSRVLG